MEGLTGQAVLTNMLIKELAVGSNKLVEFLTHLFVIIGLPEVYEELFWMLRSECKAFKNVEHLVLLIPTLGLVNNFDDEDHMDKQSISSMTRLVFLCEVYSLLLMHGGHRWCNESLDKLNKNVHPEFQFSLDSIIPIESDQLSGGYCRNVSCRCV
jgi:hypothetical protein